MRVLQTYRSLNTKFGGPARFIPALSRELAKIECETSILTFEGGGATIVEPVGSANIILARFTNSELLSTLVAVKKRLIGLRGNVDLVHLHGIWPPLNWIVSNWAEQNNIPAVVSLHSSLQPWELDNTSISQIKKRIAWLLYAREVLARCHVVSVTGINELEALKSTGIPTTVALIPIGINTGEFGNLPSLQAFHHFFPHLKRYRILLFVSRLHSNKGLSMLAYAWGKLALEFPDWHLLIVGSDQNNLQKRTEKILRSYTEEESYTFTGHLDGRARLAVYRAADLFVLPSFSENFGIVVPEALYAGIPVITTTETPWDVIEKENCGWIIPPQLDALENVLRLSMRTPASERAKMGENGKKLVESRYEAGLIARKMKNLYEWILKRRPRPEFVSLLKGGSRISLPFSKPRKLY